MPLKLRLADVATTMLVVCAVIVTVVVVRQALSEGPRDPAPTRIDDAQALLDGRRPVIGRGRATRTMLVFSDYACPYCRDLDQKLATLAQAHPDAFAVVRFENPLPIHPHAMQAAIASKCAARDANYTAFHEHLVEASDALDKVDYLQLAKLASLAEMPAFEACMRASSTRNAVEDDMRLAERLGFKGTPAFIIDGLAYNGTRDTATLEALLLD